MGYEPDEIDPTRIEEDEEDEDSEWDDLGEDGEVAERGGADYVILSKSLSLDRDEGGSAQGRFDYPHSNGGLSVLVPKQSFRSLDSPVSPRLPAW